MRPVKRTIYAYESKFFVQRVMEDPIREMQWDSNLSQQIFDYIIDSSEAAKIYEQENEWFFNLGQLYTRQVGGYDMLYGWFESNRLGLRTDLRKRSTLEIRENPKAPDESETRKTFFLLRLNDGLMLLDSYGGNVVTNNRLAAYLKIKAAHLFHNEPSGILFLPLVSEDFLNQIQNFDFIRVARLRVNTVEVPTINRDAIDELRNAGHTINANYIDIAMGRKNARTRGLTIDSLVEWVTGVLRNRQRILSATIEGRRGDGGSPVIKLEGIEEKFPSMFDVDPKGEVLQEQMFDFILELGRNHRMLR